MTIKNVIKLVMKLKVRRVNTSAPAKAVAFYFVKTRRYEFEAKQKVQGYIVQEGF